MRFQELSKKPVFVENDGTNCTVLGRDTKIGASKKFTAVSVT